MRRGNRLMSRGRPTFDLLVLTYAAGTMDALSYLHTGVFAANMTGNTVLLGLSVSGVDRSRTSPAAVALRSSCLGALFAALAASRDPRAQNWQEDLKLGAALELPFAIAFTCFYFITPHARNAAGLLAIAAGACTLGVQSVAVRRLKIAGVATTFVTGSITTAVLTLVKKGPVDLESGAPGSALVLFGMFAIYVLSAAAAAALIEANFAAVAVVPVGVVAAVELRSLAAA